MKKWVVALLVVIAVLIVVAVGALTGVYFMVYRPLLSAYTYVGGAQRLESGIADTSHYDPPGTGELTDDQVARFVRVEERVEKTVGARIATFRTQYERLTRTDGKPTSRAVRDAMAAIGGVYLAAKQAQCRALDEVRFSKGEYEWVREQVYIAAGLPFAKLDLSEILVDPGNLEQIIGIRRGPRHAVVADLNRQLVERRVATLKDWLPLAFFEL